MRQCRQLRHRRCRIGYEDEDTLCSDIAVR